MEKTIKKKRNRYILPYIFLFFSIVTLIFAIYFKNKYQDDLTLIDESNTPANVTMEQSTTNNEINMNFNNSTPEKQEISPTIVDDLSSTVILPFEVYSDSIYLYDLDTNEVLYTKNPQKQMSPASLTKVMTALLAMELVDDLDSEILTFTEEMAEELYEYGYSVDDIATFNFEVGEKVSMKSALYILMLRSANDAANLIGYSLGGGSMEKFVNMMNDKAKEIGAYDTHFTNPHGLDDTDLFTTAYDMFLITQQAMKNPEFKKICSSVTYPLPASNMREAVTIQTVISIHNPSKIAYYNPNVIGIKTGYTDAAGKCLISSYSNEGKNYLLVLMGTPIGGNNPAGLFFEETTNIYNWAYSQFS